MKTFCMAMITLFLTEHARVTVSPKTKVSCGSIQWLGDATIHLQDSAQWFAEGSIMGCNSISRFFILDSYASLKRKIESTSSYLYPIGYNGSYRGFTLDMKSLGATGPAGVSVSLIPNVSGNVNYEKYFPSSDTTCVSGSWVEFNCLSQDGWHCDGPSDYEYTVAAVAPDYCGGIMHRIIKTSTGSNNWQDSIESVIGSLGESFCQYSNWSGGRYKNFSDFAVVSSVNMLPVTLVELQADALNQKCIRVSWRTETELNNDKFLVGQSTDGVTFTVIGEIAGFGTTSIRHDYFFDDCEVVPNTVYYYQLEQIDYDGAIHWSPIVSARINGEEVLERKFFNVLGQEIPESTTGIQIVQVTTSSGTVCSKIFKPLP